MVATLARQTQETGDWADFVTIQDAAALLRVSQSTIWRWLKNETLHGFRRGGRRVWLRRSELESLTAPIGVQLSGDAGTGGKPDEQRLSTEEQQRTLAAIDAAERFQARLLQARGGKLFDSAADEIAAARRLRSAQRG